MKQTDWKIIYSRYSGAAKRAVNLLSKEAGQFLIREEGAYCIYVLPCEREGCTLKKNNFIIGIYEESPTLRQYLSSDEVPAKGFAVKIMPNPQDPEGRLVLLAAHKDQELYYAAVHFLDDYVTQNGPLYGTGGMIFDAPLPEYFYSEEPDNETRSVFTWGHSISNYRDYIDNLARAKFNELIVWNDFVPVNMDEIIDYAHSYGIRVILGYAWGWKPGCSSIVEMPDEVLSALKKEIVDNYSQNYVHMNCDGIYFQSFTEMQRSNIGEQSIAELVVQLVNDVSEALWQITPDLRLIFGLHATSVREDLAEIAKVHPRIEILWEDCGQFPYSYDTGVTDPDKLDADYTFIKNLLELRGGVGVGLVFKGVMMLNWSRFVHQAGPYVMGENTARISAHDRQVRSGGWQRISAAWTESSPDALNMMHFINRNKKGSVHMCLAGTFDGALYFPVALCGEMFRKEPESAAALIRQVGARGCVSMN